MTDVSMSTHTLADLRSILGEASEDEIRAYHQGVDDHLAANWGKQVATPRIVTDAPHIIGDAHVAYQACSDSQRHWLPAISEDTLRLAVGAVMLASSLYEQRMQASKASRTEVGEASGISNQAKTREVARRDILYSTVLKIAAGVEPYASRIADVYSKAESPVQIADATDGLIVIARDLMKDRTPGIVARRKTARLTAAWLDEAASHSADLRTVGKKTEVVRSAPAVSASDVDLRDGWALMLLDEIITAFDRAHEADPTIPRINVYSLRNALRPPTGRKPKQGDGPAPGTPDA